MSASGDVHMEDASTVETDSSTCVGDASTDDGYMENASLDDTGSSTQVGDATTTDDGFTDEDESTAQFDESTASEDTVTEGIKSAAQLDDATTDDATTDDAETDDIESSVQPDDTTTDGGVTDDVQSSVHPEDAATNDVVTETEDDPDSDDESVPAWQMRLIRYLQQMMFVSGETAEASAETAWVVEEIVREQVVEMVSVIDRFHTEPLLTSPSSSRARLSRPVVDLGPSRRTTSSF